MIVGYARCSTLDQSVDGQKEALKKAGCTKIWSEKVSGAAVRGDRRVLLKMISALKRGDTVVVTRLDRAGRSLRELLVLLDDFDEMGVKFKSLADTWCDTGSAHGRLLISILGSLAEFERELIRARTGEGRARAMANGVQFGRKPKLTPHQRSEALQRRGNGETLAQIARSYAVSVSMISRL